MGLVSESCLSAITFGSTTQRMTQPTEIWVAKKFWHNQILRVRVTRMQERFFAQENHTPVRRELGNPWYERIRQPLLDNRSLPIILLQWKARMKRRAVRAIAWAKSKGWATFDTAIPAALAAVAVRWAANHWPL